MLKQKLAQAQNVLKTKEIQLNESDLKLKSFKKLKSLATLEEERDRILEDIKILKERLENYQIQEAEAKVKFNKFILYI